VLRSEEDDEPDDDPEADDPEELLLPEASLPAVAAPVCPPIGAPPFILFSVRPARLVSSAANVILEHAIAAAAAKVRSCFFI
jgi:hypothetical protein